MPQTQITTVCFSDLNHIQGLISDLRKEQKRVTDQAKIAHELRRSDRHEWKLRLEAVISAINALNRLHTQVLVTSKIPVI